MSFDKAYKAGEEEEDQEDGFETKKYENKIVYIVLCFGCRDPFFLKTTRTT